MEPTPPTQPTPATERPRKQARCTRTAEHPEGIERRVHIAQTTKCESTEYTTLNKQSSPPSELCTDSTDSDQKSHTDTDTDTRSVYMFASLSLCVVCVVCAVRTANGAMKSACCAQYGWALLRGLCVCVWAIGCVERI